MFSSIVGPRCLLTAVTEGVSIPNNGSPIYTMAMADMKIALSSFPPNKKVFYFSLLYNLPLWYIKINEKNRIYQII